MYISIKQWAKTVSSSTVLPHVLFCLFPKRKNNKTMDAIKNLLLFALRYTIYRWKEGFAYLANPEKGFYFEMFLQY
jgi:hypothetical protein